LGCAGATKGDKKSNRRKEKGNKALSKIMKRANNLTQIKH
jgi:hypothetical protein